jgi:hypothetical protein
VNPVVLCVCAAGFDPAARGPRLVVAGPGGGRVEPERAAPAAAGAPAPLLAGTHQASGSITRRMCAECVCDYIVNVCRRTTVRDVPLT